MFRGFQHERRSKGGGDYCDKSGGYQHDLHIHSRPAVDGVKEKFDEI